MHFCPTTIAVLPIYLDCKFSKVFVACKLAHNSREYQLGNEIHWAAPNGTISSNRWTPIPALFRDDADVQLAYLSAPEIRYAAPVLDPWFSAQKKMTSIYANGGSNSSFAAYSQDEPLGVMGCIQQMQYCNPNLPGDNKCEPLRGAYDPRRDTALRKIFNDEAHFNVLDWADSTWLGSYYPISQLLSDIGASALVARNQLVYGYSGPLPDNQWQIEAEHWTKGSLASVQNAFVLAANGLPEALEDFRVPPAANMTLARGMCSNQKIVSNAYSSFNVLGVSLILVLGVIIIALDMGLEPLVASLQRRKYNKLKHDDEATDYNQAMERPYYSMVEWSQTNMLQLQRLAHEEAGYGEWSKCNQDVPVTEPGQLIAALDLSNLTHPRLQRKQQPPSSTASEVFLPAKPWTVQRSDTGIDTLIEEAQSEKGKKFEGEDDIHVVVHAIRPGDGTRGTGVQSSSSPLAQQEGAGDWRTLR